MPETRLKKGDRVEFTDRDGTTHYGVVKGVRSGKVTVIEDGGEMRWSGGGFRPSNHPMPKEIPTPMDAYEVRNYRTSSLGHGDSELFEAKIYKDGKPILVASNDGWGGCNAYHSVVNKQKGVGFDVGTPEFYEMRRGIEKQFLEDAQEWARLNGKDDLHEAADIWISWYVHSKPYGVTAKAYFDDWKKEMQTWEAEQEDDET